MAFVIRSLPSVPFTLLSPLLSTGTTIDFIFILKHTGYTQTSSYTILMGVFNAGQKKRVLSHTLISGTNIPLERELS